MQRTVKKPSRLKRGVYRAGDIGRQSRPLGQTKRFFFLKIRGRSRRRNYARGSASICARNPIHGAGQAEHSSYVVGRHMNRAVARTHFYRRAPGSKFAPLNKEYGFLEFRNFTAKVRKISVDFRGEVWYVVLLTKGG